MKRPIMLGALAAIATPLPAFVQETIVVTGSLMDCSATNRYFAHHDAPAAIGASETEVFLYIDHSFTIRPR